MYKLQWAYLTNKDGNNIPATDLVYNDTDFVYEDIEDAEHDRLMLMKIQKSAAKQNVKYFKIKEL
jgi:hypothetical protein